MKRKPWRKYLVKAELNHLKEIHVRTKKDFIEVNDGNNSRRKMTGALEPCYQCKTIALKLGLEVVARGKLVVVKEEPVGLNFLPAKLKDNNLKKEGGSMSIGKIKCPILRRLCLCSVIVPCVVVVTIGGIWQQLKFAYVAGCETFVELWEGYNDGKTDKGFD